MRKLLVVISSILTLCCITPSCSKSESKATDVDSSAINDSINRAKAIADSLANIEVLTRYADSINRAFVTPDLAFFDAHGTIDTIYYESSCEWVGSPRSDIMPFDSLGVLHHPDATHSGSRITRFASHTFGWTGDKVTFMGSTDFGSDQSQYEALGRSYLHHTYAPDGKLTESEARHAIEGVKVLYTYAVTDTDRYGNWTTREVTRREIEAGSKRELHKEVIPEVRYITYRVNAPEK